MPDLHDQLAQYVDAIAEPITYDEVAGTRPLGARRPTPRRPMIAVLAGAAIVLLPALVLAVVRWLPTDDAANPTTTEPGVTTTLAAGQIAVPDVVGQTVGEATQSLRALGFEVAVVGDGSLDAVVVSQDPRAGILEQSGVVVRIEVAGPAATCAGGYTPSLAPIGPNEVDVAVFYDCGDGSEFPRPTATVRRVSGDADQVVAILEALLAGPTEDEVAAGFGSFFSAASADALRSVVVDGSRATVDFTSDIYINNASTSTGSMFFLAELNANLFQFEDIQEIDYQVDGSRDAFWGWLQRDPQVVDRGNWLYQVDQWEELRPNGSTVITPIPAEGLGEGIVTVRYSQDGERIVWLAADPLTSGDFSTVEIVRFGTYFSPPRIVASDLMGGIVYESAGRVRWLAAGADRPVDVTSIPEDGYRFTVVDAAAGEAGVTKPVLIVSDWQGTDLEAIDLQSMESVEAEQVRSRIAEELPYSIRLVESTVRVPGVDEYYEDAYPTFLVVTARGGDEIARIRVSTDKEPYVTLHAYDGRRALLSRYPYEPALPPETYILLDVECGWECTRLFYSGGFTSASLTGAVEPAQRVGSGWPAGPFESCSAEGTSDELGHFDTVAVPEAVSDTRRMLALYADLCGVSWLDAKAIEDGTSLVMSHRELGPNPMSTLEEYRLGGQGGDPMLQLVEALAAPFDEYTAAGGTRVWVWPAAASPTVDWTAISDSLLAEYRSVYGSEVVDESVAQGGWAGWWVEIDESGRWRFFGRALT